MSGRRHVHVIPAAQPETGVVQDMTADGKGIVTLGGKRVFVDLALTGEHVTLLRRRRRSSFDEADLQAVAEASPYRVEPGCEYFWRCGGCSLQHMDEAGQLQLKDTALHTALQRIGNVQPARPLPPVAGPPWGYRRRARLTVRDVPGKGRVLVGFRERLKPYVTDMRDCRTLAPAAAALIGPLSELIGRLSIRSRLPQVEVTVADNATAIILRVLAEPAAADREHLAAFRAAHAVRLWLERSDGAGAVPLDADLDGGELWYELPESGMRITFGPSDFVQVNAQVNRRLIDLALGLLAPGPGERILDLYCGVGNFSLPLARRAGAVTGIEFAAAMVERARLNATRNGVTNVRFEQGDLTCEAGLSRLAGRWDGVLLDPPRAGAAQLLPALAASGVRRIVYVSCHPGTLARDAGSLVHEHGYRLEASGILDMFPQTSHVESIALFERP